MRDFFKNYFITENLSKNDLDKFIKICAYHHFEKEGPLLMNKLNSKKDDKMEFAILKTVAGFLNIQDTQTLSLN